MTWGGDWKVILRDGPRCSYCNLGDTADPRVWRNLDIDHLIPVSEGGPKDEMINKVVSCHACNETKGGWNPATDGLSLTEETRGVLVQRAKDHIDRRNVQSGEGEPDNYPALMQRIRAGQYPGIRPSA